MIAALIHVPAQQIVHHKVLLINSTVFKKVLTTAHLHVGHFLNDQNGRGKTKQSEVFICVLLVMFICVYLCVHDEHAQVCAHKR